MNRVHACQIYAILILCFALSAFAQEAQDSKTTRDEKWREDVRFYAEQLPKLHKNLFFHLPKEDFEREIKQLEKDVMGEIEF